MTVHPDQATELRRSLGLLTEQEVADVLEVEIRTLQNWRSERTGPPFTRVGRKVFYRVEALQEHLAAAEKETQP